MTTCSCISARLIRAYHDAAATFPWAEREWCFEPRLPVETVCHNELLPSNTVFRAGVPVVLIDWDTAAPGPRAWDLGMAAWRWVPFFVTRSVEQSNSRPASPRRRAGFVCCSTWYGLEPDIGIVHAGIERMRKFLALQQKLLADGSEHEVELARRGVLDEAALEIAWVEEHAVALVEA